MAANYAVKVGSSYLFGSLTAGELNHMEFDRPVKKIRTPIETMIGAEIDNTGVLIDSMWAGGVLTFPNNAGYPIALDVVVSDSYGDDYYPLVVEEYGDVANEDYFDVIIPETPEPPEP